MRLRTVILLAAAAVCAIGATVLTRMNMMANRTTVRVDQKLVNPHTSTIVVAAKDLSFGKALDKSMLLQVDWPTKLLPAGAYSKISDLVGKQGGRVVLSKITKGEPILKAKVSKPGQRPSLSGALAETKSAVTIRVDDVQGVAGFIQPEDFVDVLLTRRMANKPPAGTPSITDPGVFTDILLQNVKVLAVDQRFVRSTSAKPARAVTLEVDQIQAQKLVLAASVGKLSLTLKNNPASKTQQPRRISLDDLPNSAKPANEPPAQIVSEKDEGPADPVVTIVRGAGKRQTYRVPDERNSSSDDDDHVATADPEEQQAAPQRQSDPQKGPIVSRSGPTRTSPPLTGWRTRWSRDIADAINARKKKNRQEEPVFPLPQ